ncbi:MAG: hypothetical protein GAK33_00060 [Burkholderia lata]|uniref:Auxin efflux carrier n=1 Tax=Burkholderia lata (strain ATCC 17760 / DSM 23089 / LMG 22485 / NCIMB 9086 / R18194 / 383) TaxID=482957 RepID=A0A833PZ61_BURL3|nr:hypothetical protein [Burkholderia lata]KAF1040443.1 MAG: hypothetical protein GAK33_00060 [Burkholderia lata]
MTAQLSSALVPFFFSIAMGFFAGAWFCVRLFSVPAPMAGQLVLLAAIPCGSFGILFGLGYDIDDPTAGATLVASSLLSAVTLTITISLLRFV